MLRLTTNVTVSPASSARSSSAATRICSIASGRVSANIAVSSSALNGRPSRPFSIARETSSGRIGTGGSVRVGGPPDPRRGMKLQYLSLIVSSTPWETHSGSMYCGYTHSRSVSAKPSACRRLRTWWGEGNGCSGEMWSPLADSPPRSVAPAATSSLHQSARFGGIWMPTSGISRRVSAISRFMSSIETAPAPSVAHFGSGSRGRTWAVHLIHAGTPILARRRVGYLGRLLPVVALVGHEVLQDHLLDVAVLGVQVGQRLQRCRCAPRRSRRSPRECRW